jgi:hypothetical protein
LPVSVHLFIYRKKIGKLYGISGLVNGVKNLTGACPVKYIEDVERSEFNRGGQFKFRNRKKRKKSSPPPSFSGLIFSYLIVCVCPCGPAAA